MPEAIRQFLIGAGSVLLAPAGLIPPKSSYRVTVFSRGAAREIGGDFARFSSFMKREIERKESEKQLDLGL